VAFGLGGTEKRAAIHTTLQRIGDVADDHEERDRRIATAWRIGASAQELHDATGLSGDELKTIIVQQGEDPKGRRRGWRRR